MKFTQGCIGCADGCGWGWNWDTIPPEEHRVPTVYTQGMEGSNLLSPGLDFIPNKFFTGRGSLKGDPFRISELPNAPSAQEEMASPIASGARQRLALLKGLNAGHLTRDRPPARVVIELMIDARPAVGELHLIAAGLRNGFVLDDANAGHAP
jgi:hypothetical protein